MFYCFVDPNDIQEEEIIIRGENFKHLTRVLRAKHGEKIKVRSDNYIYIVKIAEVKKNELKTFIIEKKESEPEMKHRITLAPALIQEKHFDMILQFGVQLGVTEFRPIITHNVANHNVKGNKIDRWKKIIEAAAMQSQRAHLPLIHPAAEFEHAVHELITTETKLIIPYELEEKKKMADVISGIYNHYIIFVGPEGGWSEKEVDTAKKNGTDMVSLGRTVLRTETAALVAVTLLKNCLGYI